VPQLGQKRAPSGSGWPQKSHSMGFSIGGAADPAAAPDGAVEGGMRAAMRDSGPMEPTTFERPEDFRTWLEQHHDSEQELWVGYYKKGSGKQSMTWSESVDEALAFGWIDGIRKRIDDERYMNRFTPRRVGSNWSAVNIARVTALSKEGRMHPAGLKAFEARREDRSGIYSYEQRDKAVFDPAFEKRFRAKKRAWASFEAMPRSYRQAAIRWVMTAKKEETRERRLARLIEDSVAGRRVPPLTP
jgi:uncharacterized protein YdeI (YjbR/CyaY-like superfamily)